MRKCHSPCLSWIASKCSCKIPCSKQRNNCPPRSSLLLISVLFSLIKTPDERTQIGIRVTQVLPPGQTPANHSRRAGLQGKATEGREAMSVFDY